ncbi:Hsp20/alpha crystallin family protein [Calderihabitans maritimus]|uniref:SHSP domain-containing protein n=1 Tax=Calderihabitans maritimus TaxID=1246530 RepID=A0A1Z5HX79_9FIRM|nr:Hsp20/alpha crystallin family protein [Calderihabitans maritimus]GAW93967.1 hypothetical protein Daud_1494 [Calderihabitans maritimus]
MHKKKEGSEDISINLGFGDLFKGLGNLIDLIKQMEAEGKSEISHTGEIGGLDKERGLRGLYGINIRLGQAGTAKVKPFGNISKDDKGLVIREIVEPSVDIFEENDAVLVIVEVPGVKEEDFHLKVDGDILVISAQGSYRHYRKEMLLPVPVDQNGITTAFKNGVVEIRLPKKTADSGEREE